MNYEESIEWLNTIPLSFDRENKNYEFKLDGIKSFLSHLNNPQSNLKIIHVGGTNGKGSTCSFISSVLQESGFKIGAFTSPHIKDFRERIRIGKDFIDRDFVVEFIMNNRSDIERMGLTYFEISIFFHIRNRVLRSRLRKLRRLQQRHAALFPPSPPFPSRSAAVGHRAAGPPGRAAYRFAVQRRILRP